MTKLIFRNNTYETRENETVLEAFLRHGVNITFSCRSGTCHVCLHRCVSGGVPAAAQKALRPSLRARGYFLPCKCVPVGDMAIEPARPDDLYVAAVVQQKETLGSDVCRLLLEPTTDLHYRAGQYINLRRPDGLSRGYSLASVPGADGFLELHVRRTSAGGMSAWIFESLKAGDEVEIQGPHGNCCYVPGDKSQPLLLIGTGTGLAPLLGIARDALLNGHTGPIHLYHGSRHPEGVYLDQPLRDLAAHHPNLRYQPCVSGASVPEGFAHGRAHDVAFGRHTDLRGWRVYLAGLPEMVQAAQARAAKAGAHTAEIHADPFGPVTAAAERADVRDPVPDPEMWQALREGDLLTTILTDFYARVYDDPRLAPFFHGVTKQRSIEKQFLFLRQIFTGQKVYFGDRPRNAHHWMVISDELFDYREDLMEDCLRRHGLPGHLVRRWRAMEESYRADIVKAGPWKRVLDGMELPVDGFGEAILEVGTLCDGCGNEIAAGETARYHLRLGTTYCRRCGAGVTASPQLDPAVDDGAARS